MRNFECQKQCTPIIIFCFVLFTFSRKNNMRRRKIDAILKEAFNGSIPVLDGDSEANNSSDDDEDDEDDDEQDSGDGSQSEASCFHRAQDTEVMAIVTFCNYLKS